MRRFLYSSWPAVSQSVTLYGNPSTSIVSEKLSNLKQNKIFLNFLLNIGNTPTKYSRCKRCAILRRNSIFATRLNCLVETYTVGTCISGNSFFVYTMRMHVFPTIPSPTTVIFKGRILFISVKSKKKQARDIS